MGIFNIDSKAYKFLTKVGDFMILGFLMVVFSIPLITAGASITAAYYVALKTVRDDEGYVWQNFIRSWKKNMKQSICIELLLLFFGGIFFLDVKFFYDWAVNNGGIGFGIIAYAIFGLFIIVSAIAIYVFPLLAQFENTVKGILKNSVVLCLHHFLKTIIMMVATYGLLFLSLEIVTLFIITIPLTLFIDSYILSKIFEPYLGDLIDNDDYDDEYKEGEVSDVEEVSAVTGEADVTEEAAATEEPITTEEKTE